MANGGVHAWFNGNRQATTTQTVGEATRGDDSTAALGGPRVDEQKLTGHVNEVVRSSVEATLNGLLDAEADVLCRAQRYQRSPERVDRRAGHYERKLETQAGEVTLRVPKLRSLPSISRPRGTDSPAVMPETRCVSKSSSGG